MTQFGSGWGWLALDGDTLKILKTPNGANPLVEGMTPLLGIDVWEHAYYLDYENRRPEYVAASSTTWSTGTRWRRSCTRPCELTGRGATRAPVARTIGVHETAPLLTTGIGSTVRRRLMGSTR